MNQSSSAILQGGQNQGQAQTGPGSSNGLPGNQNLIGQDVGGSASQLQASALINKQFQQSQFQPRIQSHGNSTNSGYYTSTSYNGFKGMHNVGQTNIQGTGLQHHQMGMGGLPFQGQNLVGNFYGDTSALQRQHMMHQHNMSGSATAGESAGTSQNQNSALSQFQGMNQSLLSNHSLNAGLSSQMNQFGKGYMVQVGGGNTNNSQNDEHLQNSQMPSFGNILVNSGNSQGLHGISQTQNQFNTLDLKNNLINMGGLNQMQLMSQGLHLPNQLQSDLGQQNQYLAIQKPGLPSALGSVTGQNVTNQSTLNAFNSMPPFSGHLPPLDGQSRMQGGNSSLNTGGLVNHAGTNNVGLPNNRSNIPNFPQKIIGTFPNISPITSDQQSQQLQASSSGLTSLAGTAISLSTHSPLALKKFDVLEAYEDGNVPNIKFSIFKGGIDTGIDIGNFTLPKKESDYVQQSQLGQSNPLVLQNKLADRFIGPFCRSTLNNEKLFAKKFLFSSESDEKQCDKSSEQQSTYLMEKYFRLINTSMHIQQATETFYNSDGSTVNCYVESESFSQSFRLPECYDMPKFRERASNKGPQHSQQSTFQGPPSQLNTSQGVKESLSTISLERCQKFPDYVLFYIFYSMPFDRAQIDAAKELKARNWFHLEEQMRWVRLNNTGLQAGSILDGAITFSNSESLKMQTKTENDTISSSTLIIFNPALWREEIISVLED